MNHRILIDVDYCSLEMRIMERCRELSKAEVRAFGERLRYLASHP